MTNAVDLGPVRKDLRALDDKSRRRVLRAVMALEFFEQLDIFDRDHRH